MKISFHLLLCIITVFGDNTDLSAVCLPKLDMSERTMPVYVDSLSLSTKSRGRLPKRKQEICSTETEEWIRNNTVSYTDPQDHPLAAKTGL